MGVRILLSPAWEEEVGVGAYRLVFRPLRGQKGQALELGVLTQHVILQ